jgi:ZIP family zinc transporter
MTMGTFDGWAGVALIAIGTLFGARLGRRAPQASSIPLAAACGALVAVVAADLGPDVWGDVRDTGIAWWIVAVAGVAGYVGAGYLMKRGCPCEPGLAGGVGTAAALGLHRALEGSALAVAASAPLVLALVIHASSEGFALTSLLDAEKHRPRAMTGWLTVACAAPAFGMVVVGSIGLPDQAKPVVTSLVAGVLVRTAWNAYQIAATRGQRLAARGVTIVSAGLLASALTVLSHLG